MTDIASNGNDQLKLDTNVAHSARLWNYLLGGRDNFAVDREAAEEVLAYMPELVQSARFNREFLGRAVRYLAGEAGIRQFLDIGTGLPTANNTHEVAQASASPEEAAAIAAAIEQFLRDTAPPPAAGSPGMSPWLRAALFEGVGHDPADLSPWGDAEPWGG